VKDRLRDNTDAAARAGACGAPTFLVQASDDDPGMLFWGQDRLVLVERALGGWRPACG
jgi:2-hydroxychromene-2-carboxylate isomerase